jgi:4-hydroxybenzoate-CoA ligase/benzoate-CoA ligase
MDAWNLPRDFNVAAYFIDGHEAAGRGDKVAFIDDDANWTYRQLAERVNRVATGLIQLGLRPESRIAMVMLDSIDFASVFWGAIKGGFVPIAINTLLTTEHYRYILDDSRATTLMVSAALYPMIEPVLGDLPHIEHVIVANGEADGRDPLDALLAVGRAECEPADTRAGDVAFWLYSSGSTGDPKGVKHLHGSLPYTARTYGRQVLGFREDDVVYSAPKLFFAYGLGNSMTFPLAVGATTVVSGERPTPELVIALLERHKPTIFFGVPTLFAAMLADPRIEKLAGGESRLRLCVSSGEALPVDIAERGRSVFGTPIIEGVGSTELLHIFMSNRPDDYKYGSQGKPVPGYKARLVDDAGGAVADGEIGELVVSGASSAEGYWNQRDKSLATFVGAWTHTGDKYIKDEEGYYHICGRTDDVFKSGGNWVSPFDVEAVLIGHDAVLEAAVVAHPDEHGNNKPKAFVVLTPGYKASSELEAELKAYVQERAERWKYPRWIEFRDDLPKTATGKIQRFKLRDRR